MTALVSLLFFTAVSSTVALAASLVWGTLTTEIAWGSVAVGGLAFYFCWRLVRPLKLSFEPWTRFDKVMIFLFVLFCYREFFWIYYHRDAGVFTLDTSNLGDLPLHLTYITHMAHGGTFWPHNPIFTGLNLHYPFGMDLFAALFIKLGLSLSQVLPLTGFVFGILTLASLYIWGRGFALGSFLFSGGVAGFIFLASGNFHDFQADAAWKNIPLTLLIPQRGFLFAFPAGLLLLWSWRRKFIQGMESLPLLIEGLLWGMLPFFHLHTFLFLSLVFSVWVLAAKKYRDGTLLLAWAFLPAALEVFLMTDGFRSASMIWIKPGWMIGKENILLFFWKNYGIYFPLVFWALYLALRRRQTPYLLLLLPGLGFYAIFLFVMTAPWEWDNTKVMVWCYLLILPAIYDLIVSQLLPTVRTAVLCCLFFSGFIAVLGSYRSGNVGVQIFERPERDQVCTALQGISPDERFATAQNYNHPVALCGHSLVAGYSGHLWSHGIKGAAVEAKLKQLMEGHDQWRQIAGELQARYLFWGPREEKDFRFSPKPWENETRKIAEGPWGKIFDLKGTQ